MVHIAYVVPRLGPPNPERRPTLTAPRPSRVGARALRVTLVLSLALGWAACGRGSPACAEGHERYEGTCGLNGRGRTLQRCVEGAYQAAGCEDPDTCSDGATEPGSGTCGLEGSVVRFCHAGAWTSACREAWTETLGLGDVAPARLCTDAPPPKRFDVLPETVTEEAPEALVTAIKALYPADDPAIVDHPVTFELLGQRYAAWAYRRHASGKAGLRVATETAIREATVPTVAEGDLKPGSERIDWVRVVDAQGGQRIVVQWRLGRVKLSADAAPAPGGGAQPEPTEGEYGTWIVVRVFDLNGQPLTQAEHRGEASEGDGTCDEAYFLRDTNCDGVADLEARTRCKPQGCVTTTEPPHACAGGTDVGVSEVRPL